MKTCLQNDLYIWWFVFSTCVIWGVSWHFWGSFLRLSARSCAKATIKRPWCEALSSVFGGHGGPPGMNLRFEDIKQFWQRFVKSNWIWLYFEAVWHNSVLVRILRFTGTYLDWKLTFKLIWPFDDLWCHLGCFLTLLGVIFEIIGAQLRKSKD